MLVTQRIMKNKFPIFIFIALQLACGMVLTLWVVWSTSAEVPLTWLLQGIILMAAVIGGAFAIFVYWTKAKALDTDRINFLSSVSHELLTPLSSIRLGLETMQIRELDKDRKHQFLTLMVGDTERLSELIGKILVATRIEKRKAFYKLQPRELATDIRRFLEENRALLKDAVVKSHLQDDCHALLDPDAFKMVLKNLLQNAVQYSPPPAKIGVTLKRLAGDLMVEVVDAGEGIDPKNLKRIFGLFHRESTKRGGTGVGLFIVKNIIRDHGGKVWADSQGPGLGTRVRLLLPAVEGLAP